MYRFCLFFVIAFAVTAADSEAVKLESGADVTALLFPSDENRTNEALRLIFGMEQAGSMIALAAKLGPSYASKVVSIVPSEDMKASYRELAKYLDLWGPCQKEQSKDAEGWWSNYPLPKHEGYCSEAAKLLISNLMRTQVHYCVQLLNGEAEPKVGGPYKPRPWKLDEPPVKTQWLKATEVYRLVDAAVKFDVVKSLADHCQTEREPERKDCSVVVSELGKDSVNREMAGLALAKFMLRHYESVHLRHLETKLAEKQQ